MVALQVGTAEPPDRVPGEDAVFSHYLAPCCWQQTLDVHASPEAAALRDEVRARLRAGESREAIEAALVERYGPRIVAMPSPNRVAVLGPLSLAAALLVGGAFVARTFRRRRDPAQADRAHGEAATKKLTPAADDAELDARIDAELAELEG